MRALSSLVVLFAGCSSESSLVNGLDQRLPTTTTPITTETVPDTTPPDPGLAVLEGVVCAPDGQTQVAFATVTLNHDAGSVESVTDGDGWFRMTDLPPGTWDVMVEKGSFVSYLVVTLEAGHTTTLAVDDCIPLEQDETEIAVVTGLYDDIGAMLTELGLDYDVVGGINGDAYVDFMRSPEELAKYDIIFFNCGVANGWIPYAEEVGLNLEAYVEQGGSVYASDWAYWLVESAWPAKNDFVGGDVDPVEALVGDPQEVDADVHDPAMAAALGGDTALLNYDLGGWAAMEGSTAEVLIDGRFTYWDFPNGRTITAPLATRIEDGDGQALFTTFHNERQTTADMLTLLQEIVLSL